MRTKISKAESYCSFGTTNNICPVCGKSFVPAPYHVYHVEGQKERCCSYTCMLKGNREHEAKVKRNREMAQKRRWEREREKQTK